MEIKTIKIAIALVDPNEPLVIMDFVIIGRGSNLSHGAQWIDESEGWWEKEPTDANIQYQVDKAVESYLGPVKSWKIIEDTIIPADRDFRDAWKHEGKEITHDMEKVRKIHLERLRVARTPLLEQKDREWMRAVGQGKVDEAKKIEEDRQWLRDLPAAIVNDLEKARTPEKVKTIGIDWMK